MVGRTVSFRKKRDAVRLPLDALLGFCKKEMVIEEYCAGKKKMKNKWIWIGCLGILGIGESVGDYQKGRVRICKIADHPALDATAKGIQDELLSQGVTDVSIESAQANPSLAGQIASKFQGERQQDTTIPFVAVGVGTVAAQSLAKYARKGIFPLIFSSVTDPVGAGLVGQTVPHGSPISGVSNFVALEPQLAIFRQLHPGLATLGMIYNPGEANSTSLLHKVQHACHHAGMAFIKQSLMKTGDAAQVTQKISEKVDGIFITNDNTALSALPAIVKAAGNIPVYISDTDGVLSSGAVAALGPNQYDLGRQTGKMILRVLRGKNVQTMPVEFPDQMLFVLHESAAREKKGVIVTQELLERARMDQKLSLDSSQEKAGVPSLKTLQEGRDGTPTLRLQPAP